MKTVLLMVLGGSLLLLPLSVQATESEALDSEAEQTRSEPAAQNYVPTPLTGAVMSREMWSGRTGNVHPFVSVRGEFTDNLFNTSDNEEDEFTTIISPGIWVAFPESRQQLMQSNTLLSVPGGLAVSRFRTESTRRLQGYALYRADFEQHSRFSDEDRVNHRGEGLLNYTSPGGFSVEMLDIYEKDQDPYYTDATRTRELDTYNANLFNVNCTYPISSKFSVRADYTNYLLSFDASENAYRERDDNALSAYVFFKAMPKTAFLILYEYINIDYDQDILRDSEEQHGYGGIQWDVTAKSRGRVMLGYGRKEFQGRDGGWHGDMIGEARLDHRFTAKTSAYLRATRKTNETDILNADSILAHMVQLGYRQKFSAKWSGSADLYWLRDSYRGSSATNGNSDDREDDHYSAGFAIGYTPARWFMLGAGYRFIDRDSNLDINDYRKNTLYLSLTAAL